MARHVGFVDGLTEKIITPNVQKSSLPVTAGDTMKEFDGATMGLEGSQITGLERLTMGAVQPTRYTAPKIESGEVTRAHGERSANASSIASQGRTSRIPQILIRNQFIADFMKTQGTIGYNNRFR